MSIITVGVDKLCQTANNQNNTNLQCTHGSVPQVGDVVMIEAVLIIPGSGTTSDFTLPAGWTLTGTAMDAGTTSVRASVFRKVWANGDTLPNLQWSLAGSAMALVKIRRGVDSANPVPVKSVSVHAGTGAARVTGSITTTAGSIIEYGFGDRSGSTFTLPASPAVGSGDTVLSNTPLAGNIGLGSFAIPGVSPAGTYSRNVTASVATSIGVSWIYALTPSAAGIAPTVDAGPDATVDPNLSDTFVLSATASDPDGSIASYLWEDITGAATPVAGNGSSRIIAVTRSTQGSIRTYRVTVTDNSGLTSTDTIVITLLPHTRWEKTANGLKALRRPL